MGEEEKRRNGKVDWAFVLFRLEEKIMKRPEFLFSTIVGTLAVTLAIATALALWATQTKEEKSVRTIAVYVYPTTLAAGTKLQDGEAGNSKPIPVESDSLLVWVDPCLEAKFIS